MASAQGDELTAGLLAARTPSLTDRTSCGEVYDWFIQHPEVPAAAVLDSKTGAVLGLMNRFIFFARYAKQYVPELFGRKSILKLANRAPMVVDAEVRLADLGATLLVENPEALVEGFVVTRRGRYLGVATGEALLQGKVKLLQARESQLSEALQAETRANAAKSDFLALMSHELRTPLNAIIGFSELIQNQIYGPLQKQYRDYAVIIHESGHHLLNLVSDILDIAKIEAGKFVLDIRDVDLTESVAYCIRLVKNRADERRIKLVTLLPAQGLVFSADQRAFRQILLNLLSNAIKFSRPGDQVEVAARVTGGSLMVTVRDHGIGMPESLLARIGRPFEQAVNDPVHAREGTGLGLSLVRALIQQHGGTLSIESREGVGTAVTCELPLSRAADGASEAAA